MKIYKNIIACLLSVLTIFMVLPVTVNAEGNIDLNDDISQTILYQNGNIPLTGAQFDIYLVAAADENGNLTITDTFAGYNVNIKGQNDESMRNLANALEGYVIRDKITPTDSGKTNGNGYLTFPNTQNKLAAGLYLVLGQRHTQNGYYYDASPALIMLPYYDAEDNVWAYDTTVNVKHDSNQVPDAPGTVNLKVLKVWEDDGHEKDRPQEVVIQLLREGVVYDTVVLNADNNWRYTWTDLDDSFKWTVVEKEMENYTVEVYKEGITVVVTNTYDESSQAGPNGPDDPDGPAGPNDPDNPDEPAKPTLPQTGQLWWPVPVLFAAGLLLIVIGLIRRRGFTDEK